MPRSWPVALIATIVSVFALKQSYPVTMPVAAAAVVVAAIWPVKPWLDRILPSKLATLGTIIALIVLMVCFMGALYFSAAQTVRALAVNQERFQSYYGTFAQWTEGWGFPRIDGQSGYHQAISWGKAILADAYSVVVYVGFIGVLVSFGLPEASLYQAKIRQELSESDRREALATIDEIASKIRSYFGATTLGSLITGVATGVWVATLGLDLSVVWGLLNFLLNYIPIAGNIIGIIPPTLYAFVQFDGWLWPLMVFGGLSLIQVLISNFLAPVLQGRSVSLSPIAVVVALAFWSWVWGIAGALIAVPLTVAIMIVCEHFHETRWIATLLSGKP